LDSAVFIYAIGVDHPYRAPCRALVTAMRSGDLVGEASVLAVQEVMHQRLRRTGDRRGAGAAADDLSVFCTIHGLTAADMRRAVDLFTRGDGLDAADACHAATALNRAIPVIISPDVGFDDVAGLARMDPAEAAAQV
jgi:predicted nucleic acid-binding protein